MLIKEIHMGYYFISLIGGEKLKVEASVTDLVYFPKAIREKRQDYKFRDTVIILSQVTHYEYAA